MSSFEERFDPRHCSTNYRPSFVGGKPRFRTVPSSSAKGGSPILLLLFILLVVNSITTGRLVVFFCLITIVKILIATVTIIIVTVVITIASIVVVIANVDLVRGSGSTEVGTREVANLSKPCLGLISGLWGLGYSFRV